MILNILLTLLLVFMNAFFVAAEFAIISVRIAQIELRIRTGSKLAKIAHSIVTHLDSYLSATQLGITLASLGLGWIGESIVAEIIRNIIFFLGFNITFGMAHKIALPVAFVTITILQIVFGEQMPKLIAIQRSEKLTMLISLPLRVFYIIFRPFIWLLNEAASGLIALLGFEPLSKHEGRHTIEELRYLLDKGSESGAIGVTEHQLLENVFEFSETPVKQIMVPRGKIVAVEFAMNIREITDKFITEAYSRMPVFKDSIDNIIGIIYAKDLISLMRQKKSTSVNDILRPAYFVREEQKINVLLHDMQKRRIHVAIVLDEFGGTAGLVSLEDVIEEIFGEIQDEYDEELPLIEKLSETEYNVKASATIDDANDVLPVPLPESEDYETVGGLLTSVTGRIPEENEIVALDDYSCKILKRTARSIELVKLTLTEKEAEEEE